MGTVLLEVGFGETCFSAIGNHIGCVGSGLLDIFYPEKRLGDQRVLGHRAMGLPQQFRGKPRRQFPGIPHLDTIGKDKNLDKSVVAVIPVGNCIDNGFGNDGARDFELNRGLCACRAGAHASVDLTQNKFHRLIDYFKQPSLIGLLGCDGFALFRAIKMETMDLGVVEKPMRVLSEQKHGCICGLAVSQKIEVLKNRFGVLGPFEFHPACGLGRFHEYLYLPNVYIAEYCSVTNAAVKRR